MSKGSIRNISRRSKVIKLSKMMDLETEQLDLDYFANEKLLYNRNRSYKILCNNIRKCKLCKGMNVKCMTESVPGYGNLLSKILVVGISPGTPCMATQIPFSGGSGYLIDAALRLSNLFRSDIFISNIIHCHPISNRPPKPEEVKVCIGYLKKEIALIKPVLIITLGTLPKAIIEKYKIVQHECRILSVKHPAAYMRSGMIGSKDWIIKLSTEIDKYDNQ